MPLFREMSREKVEKKRKISTQGKLLRVARLGEKRG
jgi:hypothetical protein